MHYLTTFNQKEKSMTVDFGHGIKVVADFHTGFAYKTFNGVTKEQFPIDGMSLTEFHNILLGIEKSLS